jgi:hypothetical protein
MKELFKYCDFTMYNGPFLGEDEEYENMGLYNSPCYGLSSGGLANQQRIYFFGRSQQNFLNNINYVASDNSGPFSLFLKSTNGGGIDKAKLLNNPKLLELFYQAYTTHILAHVFEDFNQGNPITDLLMVQSNLGHVHAQEIVTRVCNRILSNQTQFFSYIRIKSNWIKVAIDGTEEKMFFLTVDGVNVYFGYLLVFFAILEDLYHCPATIKLKNIVKSHLNPNPNNLGWLRVIEQLTIHDIKIGPHYDYALDDIYGCAGFLNANCPFANRYSRVLHTYHLQDWVEAKFNVDYLSTDFVSTCDVNIEMALNFLRSHESFERALKSKWFFDGVDLFSPLKIFWGRDWLTVKYNNMSYFANLNMTVDVFNSDNQENYTLNGFGILIELLESLQGKQFKI